MSAEVNTATVRRYIEEWANDAIWIFRLADGKIAEVWRCADDLGRVVQIGGTIVPADHEHVSGALPS